MGMKDKNDKMIIRGYCSQCSCYCPTISYRVNGKFTEVLPDVEHPFASDLCPKGIAGPELVYNRQRLKFPLKRTNDKSCADPGWKRITWDEAIDTIAKELDNIKAKYGAEAVAFARSGPAGSAMSEIWPWIDRLGNAFGTPNMIATTHICQWHRDHCTSYTFGRPGMVGTAGRPEFERSACILIWGNNTHVTRSSLIPLIEKGINKGARLIVIDPRRTKIATMADLWLQICPDTDGILALSMINVIISENLYDKEFTLNWTTAPFLIRTDINNYLKASEIVSGASTTDYVVISSLDKMPRTYMPGDKLPKDTILDTSCKLKLTNGKEVECKTVFRLLRERVSNYPPELSERITQVPKEKIIDAAKTFATVKPACWYSWNGIEESINASQTNRAICILYSLTGNYDKPGGNVIPPRLPLNTIFGHEFLSSAADAKRLGLDKRPLGPGSIASRSTQGYEVYQAILAGNPYPIKALLGFGGNLVTSSAPPAIARKALKQLEFHVQAEMFLTPTAELADIVLPAASSWESWHIGINISTVEEKAHIQLRPAVVKPRYSSWPDMKIIFELAKRLGLGDKFWEGNIESAFNYVLEPLGIDIEQLKSNDGRGISLNLPKKYEKYALKNENDKFAGFPTDSKRVEIFSSIFRKHGYDPLPIHKGSYISLEAKSKIVSSYPLILINAKVTQYCHSQHRAIPSLRKAVPHPYLEINPKRAVQLGCNDRDWVLLETPNGSITLQCKITDEVPDNVVCTQNGWWQACPELDLPGYDPFSQNGANVNVLYDDSAIDPLSGSLPLKGYPCRVRLRQ